MKFAIFTFLLFTLLYVSLAQDAGVVEETIAASNATVSKAGGGNKPKRTCACDDTNEQLVCASNGITYKNLCRFNCAKARVNRLRIVKQGQCSQTGGTGAYWQKKGGRMK